MRQVISDLIEVGIFVDRDRLNYLRSKKMKEELLVHEAGTIAAQETVSAEVMLFSHNDATVGTGTISSTISGVDDELDKPKACWSSKRDINCWSRHKNYKKI